MIKSDSQGFLTTEEGTTTPEEQLILEVRDDVRRIREAILGKEDGTDDIVGSVDRLHATIKQNAAKADKAHAEAVREGVRQRQRQASPVAARPVAAQFSETPKPRRSIINPVQSVATPKRDSGGRFTRQDVQAPPASPVERSGVDISVISGKLSSVGNSIAEADPAAKAISEVAAPIGRIVGSGKSGTEKLLGRLFKWFKDTRKIDETNSKKERKLLKGILDKPMPQQGNGALSFILGGGALAAVTMLWGAIMAFLKRIPILGALLSMGAGILGLNSDDPEERQRSKQGMIGMGIGGALGVFFGPVGVAIGAFVGQIIGENLDTITSTLQAKWNQLVTALGDYIQKNFPNVAEFWDKFKNAMSDAFDWIMDKLKPIQEWFSGAKETAESVVEKTVEAYNSTKETVFEATATARETVSSITEKASSLIESTKEWFKETRVGKAIGETMNNWKLGDTSSHFEAKGKVDAISSGRGDRGGVSYGVYQFATNTGTADRFAQQSKYAKFFQGKKAGTAAFNQAWLHVAKHDPEGFRADQHDYIKRTHYDPAVRELKRHGIDVEKGGPAMKDAVWSTSVQFGPSMAVSMILKANAGGFKNDVQFVENLQNYKITNNEQLFRSSRPDVRAGTLRRAGQEKHFLVKLAASSPPTSHQKAHVGTAAAAQSVQPAPSVREPLTSQPAKQASYPKDIGQDVKDRKVAHIVTGGMH